MINTVDYKELLTKLIEPLNCEKFKEVIRVERYHGGIEISTLRVEVLVLIQFKYETDAYRSNRICLTEFDKSLSDEEIIKTVKSNGDLEKTIQTLYFRMLESIVHFSLTRKTIL
jgi:hypothetical protein